MSHARTPPLRLLALAALLLGAAPAPKDHATEPMADAPKDGETAASPSPAGAEIIPLDRRARWSPGIPGGIPEVKKVCSRLDAEKYGNGVADATAAIQAALEGCAEGQAVLLPAGTWRTTDVLWIRKGVVLRGEGPDKTRITREGAGDNWRGAVLRVMNDAAPQPPVAVVADAPLGAQRLEVADAGSFKKGDVIHLDQRDDPALVTTGDCRWFKRIDPDGVARSMGQLAEVVGKEGKALLLGAPLHMAVKTSLRPEVIRSSPSVVRGAGIEDLYLSGGVQANVDVSGASYSWLKNIESDRVVGRHLSIKGCYRCVIRDSFVHHAARDYNSGAHAYGISLSYQTTDTLVENNIVYYLNKLLLLEASGGGNVIAYNYVDDPILGQQPTWQEVAIDGSHCSHPFMTLFEGNWAPHIGAAATHGSASHLTFFRNFASSRARTVDATSNVEAVQLDAGMLYMNVVGNVLGRPGAIYEPTPDPAKPGQYRWSTLTWPPNKIYLLGGWAKGGSPQNFDPRVAATILRHGNYDEASGAVRWDPQVRSKTLPPSLYLGAKPAFFGDLPWPWVDPVRTPMLTKLPAKVRFDAMRIQGPGK